MTGRKSTKKKAAVAKQQAQATQHQPKREQASNEDTINSPPPNNIRKEQPPPPQTVKKIAKAENEEANTLKTVFKSDPNTQMKDFIKKAAKPPTTQVVAKLVAKTPADSHPPAIAQQLLDTDDDVADNLAKLFKSSKSYKNL